MGKNRKREREIVFEGESDLQMCVERKRERERVCERERAEGKRRDIHTAECAQLDHSRWERVVRDTIVLR